MLLQNSQDKGSAFPRAERRNKEKKFAPELVARLLSEVRGCDLEDNQGQGRRKDIDVTDVLDQIAEKSHMESPHEEERWVDLYKDFALSWTYETCFGRWTLRFSQ